MLRTILKYLVISLLSLSSTMISQNKSKEINAENLGSQTIPSSLLKIISIHLEEIPMQLALNKISVKGSVNLNYNSDILPLGQKVSLHAENIHTIEALLEVLQQTSTKLQITENGSLIILPIDENDVKGKIRGLVIDSGNDTPLIGANVMIKGSTIGVATNMKGEFILPSIKVGTYTLVVSYIGYSKKEFEVNVIKDRTLEIKIDLDWVAVESGDVVITAQAKGQIDAINKQLNARSIKNVVSADRIQELPDVNAAESVGRLPGVAIQRSGGEGSKVIIRGLSPKYSTMMLDGIKIASNNSYDRSTDISMISPYSLGGIEVIKSATPEYDADFVGGIVNFKLRTAPEGFKWDIISQGGYNGLKSVFNDYMFTASASNRFFENKLGIFAQFNFEGVNRSSHEMGSDIDMVNPTIEKVNSVYVASVNLKDIERQRKRIGGTLVLDYKVPNGTIFLKNFINNKHETSNIYAENYTLSQKRLFLSTTDETTDLFNMSNKIQYEQKFSIFNFDTYIAHSYSEGKKPNGLQFTFFKPRALKEMPSNVLPEEVPNYKVEDSVSQSSLNWDNLVYNTNSSRERQYEVAANLEMDFILSSQISGKIKTGGKIRSMKKWSDEDEWFGDFGSGSGQVTREYLNPLFPRLTSLPLTQGIRYPYPIFINPNYSSGDFLNGLYQLESVADINFMHQIFNALDKKESNDPGYFSESFFHHKLNSNRNDYSGEEKYQAAYLMTNFNFYNYVKLMTGVRYEYKKTEYTGVRGVSATYRVGGGFTHYDTTTVRNNEFWLPMTQLIITPNENLQIRMAYTKTLSRPNFWWLVPYFDLEAGKAIGMNFLGIKPERAENMDIYFAYHENHVGLLTVTGFIKNISDKIAETGSRLVTDPSELDLLDRYLGYKVNTLVNLPTIARIKGVEIEWQTNFWYLPGVLKGLVFNANYTYTYSRANYPRTIIKFEGFDPQYNPIYKNLDTFYVARMVDQPAHIANFTVGYDYKGFSTRLSMLYQSDIFTGAGFWEETRTFTNSITRWDLSIQQKLPWEGIKLLLRFNNITEAIDQSQANNSHFPIRMENYGRTISLAIRWSSF